MQNSQTTLLKKRLIVYNNLICHAPPKGRVVFTQKEMATKTTINLPDLSKGSYVVEVLDKEGRARKKVLVE